IGLDEVSQAVQNENVNLPTGTLFGANKAFTVEANGQLTQAESYRPLIVAYRNGSPVRLQELGRVIDSVENDKTAAWFCDREREERSIILAIQRQPGTNTVAVAGAVQRLLPSFRKELPASVSLHVLYDRPVSIQNSVNDVQFTLLLTLVLVVLVIFLFLRNVSATLIPSLALPPSIVGTFAIMDWLGYSLDNLSLLALPLPVGSVVADALGSRFLRPSHQRRHGRLYAASEWVFDASLRLYESSLRFVLRRPLATMVASLLILVATVALFLVIPMGFLPSEDNAQVFSFTEA